MPDQVLYDILGAAANHEEFHQFSTGDRWSAGAGEGGTPGWFTNFQDNLDGGGAGYDCMSSYSSGGAPPVHALAFDTPFKVRAHVLPRSGQQPRIKAARYQSNFSQFGTVYGTYALGVANNAWQWIESDFFVDADPTAPYVGIRLRDCQAIDEYQIIVNAGASITGGITADAVIRKTVLATLTADAVIRQTRTGGFGVDAVLLSPRTGGFGSDAVLLSPRTQSLTASAIVRANRAASLTLEAVIALVRHPSIHAAIDAEHIHSTMALTSAAPRISATIAAAHVRATIAGGTE